MRMSTGYAYTEQMLKFPSNIYISAASPMMTKYSDVAPEKDFKLETSTRENSFYVFGNTGYKGEYQSAGSAISAVVQSGNGLVVGSAGDTIYRSIEAESYNTVADYIDEMPMPYKDKTLMACAYMCMDYMGEKLEYTDIESSTGWEQAFADYTHGVGINISGIDLDTALYFLDRDVPFCACIDDGRYVLVISYNSSHIRYYDPFAAEEVKVTREEFENLLSMQGNTMYTYTSQ